MDRLSLKKCVVVTCFDEQQPGFLDFSYRIHALSRNFELSIISKAALCQPELANIVADYHVIPTQHGKLGWLHYLLKCAYSIHQINPDVVVLLHSALSPLSWMVRHPTCLYWNEHPFNLMRLPPAKGSLKYHLTKLFHVVFFAGAKRADLVMPIGEEHQLDLIANGVASEKIQMIYMGVSEAFLPLSKPARNNADLHLIYVGTVSEERGRDVMMRAIRLLTDENIPVKLTIVGADEQEIKRCHSIMMSLGIEQAINVVGRVSGDQIPSYLARADAAICIWQPNAWNQFNPPTKLFEYLVAGLPVLANNIATHRRYIQAWQNGLIFEYSPESLAGAAKALHDASHQLPKMRASTLATSKAYLWSELERVFIGHILKLTSPRIR